MRTDWVRSGKPFVRVMDPGAAGPVMVSVSAGVGEGDCQHGFHAHMWGLWELVGPPEARRLGLLEDGAILEQLARVRAQAAANRAMAYYQVSTAREGAEPGPETTGIRTFHVELEQRIAQLAIEMTARGSVRSSEWTDLWLRQFQSRIGGGTTDIQKNIIGERVLGLPR